MRHGIDYTWYGRKREIRKEHKEYMPTKKMKMNERMRVDVCGVTMDKLPNGEAIDRFFIYWTTPFNEELIDKHMESEDAHNPYALRNSNNTITYNSGPTVKTNSLWLEGMNTSIPNWACSAMIAYCEQEEE
tara:strand:+ start:426 stop:818 length:393 start_codon:yes stop_codon:yes gene_type:complete